MKTSDDKVPRWVRSFVCIVGCAVIPGLLMVSAFGAMLPTSLILGTVLFAIWTSALAFQVDATAFGTIAGLFRRWII